MKIRLKLAGLAVIVCTLVVAACNGDSSGSGAVADSVLKNIANTASLPVLNGQTNVQCNYSHTLPDDPILMPGMPGMSMLHDFFGNIAANANTVTADLYNTPANTCDNQADGTSYWVPSLMRSGVIVRPAYQKTYYQVPNASNYPVTPMPQGLKLIAGSPLNTGPSSAITYFCKGAATKYTSTPQTTCPAWSTDPVSGVQFNIGIQFPDCWDGHTMTPTTTVKNAVYSTNDVCPADYPVRIPTVNMNVAYFLGTNTDMSDVQLSLDPIINPDGSTTLQWGNLFTAHGDFFNGWPAQSMQYMTDYCFNKGVDCGDSIPMAYSEPDSDAYIASTPNDTQNYGSSANLYVSNIPGQQQISMLRFPLPANAATLNFNAVKVNLYGGATSSGANMIYLYPMDATWDESTVTWDNAPACPSTGPKAQLYLDNAVQYRASDVTQLIKNAIAAGETEVAFCVRGGVTTQSYLFQSKEGANKPTLLFEPVMQTPLP